MGFKVAKKFKEGRLEFLKRGHADFQSACKRVSGGRVEVSETSQFILMHVKAFQGISEAFRGVLVGFAVSHLSFRVD